MMPSAGHPGRDVAWDKVEAEGDTITVWVDDWTWKMVVATEPELIG